MSDLAFNNYCITCDQLCPQSSIYCSDSCKHIDEAQASSLRATSEQLPGLVSPLLTPSIYQHYHNYTSVESFEPQQYYQEQYQQAQQPQQQRHLSEYLTDSPLMLSKQTSATDLDYHPFDLNVSESNNILSSTSNNYRKWLTACL